MVLAQPQPRTTFWSLHINHPIGSLLAGNNFNERTARDPSAHRWCLEPAQGTTGAGAAWGLSLALLCWSYSAPPRAPVGKLRRIPASARICPAKVAVHHHHRICYWPALCGHSTEQLIQLEFGSTITLPFPATLTIWDKRGASIPSWSSRAHLLWCWGPLGGAMSGRPRSACPLQPAGWWTPKNGAGGGVHSTARHHTYWKWPSISPKKKSTTSRSALVFKKCMTAISFSLAESSFNWCVEWTDGQGPKVNRCRFNLIVL